MIKDGVLPNGARIRQLRQARNWGQRDLAEAVCVSLRTIWNIEQGKPTRSQNLKAIAKALGIDPLCLRAGVVSKE